MNLSTAAFAPSILVFQPWNTLDTEPKVPLALMRPSSSKEHQMVLAMGELFVIPRIIFLFLIRYDLSEFLSPIFLRE
jgi:hypothetical protein